MKLKTKADYRKLIRLVARATCNVEYGGDFSALLSAMRGPDDYTYADKEKITVQIRGALGWVCGNMPDEGGQVSRETISDNIDRVRSLGRQSGHYLTHADTAVEALATFGFPTHNRKRK